MSIDELMCASDVCVTDYSSLIFEYALLNRPMLFYAYDLDDYNDWRGFYYDYDELTPGPVCRSMEALIRNLEQIDETYDFERLAAFRKKFMSACDGHATERIMEYVFGSPAMPEAPDTAGETAAHAD
jgi:CDP-glycerol glycerophosphotransferase (TagB/SpsB family)